MNDLLNNLLDIISKTSDPNISDIHIKGGKLHFKYYSGKFIVLKSIKMKNLTGYLRVYHETPFSDDKHLIELDDFFVQVNNVRGFPNIRIKNHIDITNNFLGMTIDSEGMFQTNDRSLAKVFIGQLEAKMINNDFEIFLD